jgi:hypothetical protein
MAGLENNTGSNIAILIGGRVGTLPPGGQIGGIRNSPNDVDGYWHNGTFFGIDDNWAPWLQDVITWYQVSGGDNGSTDTPSNRGYHSSQPDLESQITLTPGDPANSYTVDISN